MPGWGLSWGAFGCAGQGSSVMSSLGQPFPGPRVLLVTNAQGTLESWLQPCPHVPLSLGLAMTLTRPDPTQPHSLVSQANVVCRGRIYSDNLKISGCEKARCEFSSVSAYRCHIGQEGS
jgi:hypothetical protein